MPGERQIPKCLAVTRGTSILPSAVPTRVVLYTTMLYVLPEEPGIQPAMRQRGPVVAKPLAVFSLLCWWGKAGGIKAAQRLSVGKFETSPGCLIKPPCGLSEIHRTALELFSPSSLPLEGQGAPEEPLFRIFGPRCLCRSCEMQRCPSEWYGCAVWPGGGVQSNPVQLEG